MSDKLETIPEGAYAVIATADGEIRVAGPDQTEGVTNGLLLMVGIARKMNDVEWVNSVIAEAEEYLVARQDAIKEAEQA